MSWHTCVPISLIRPPIFCLFTSVHLRIIASTLLNYRSTTSYTMRIDEQEIPSVSDKSPISEKQHRINSKKGVEGLLADIPPCNSDYQPLSISQRAPKSLASPGATPYELFQLFITPEHCCTIADHTNNKAEDHGKECKQRGECQQSEECKHRTWHSTTGPEIEVFLGIILLMGLDPLNCVEDYWTQRPDKPICLFIQEAMTLTRFQQIKRFLKINNGRTEPAGLGKGPDWWKKLEPLATEIQKASLEYYQPGDKISVDEQLIRFTGRSRHTMQISAKTAGQGFKIYSLCQENYLISFLFASKATKVSQLKTARRLGLDGRSGLSDSARLVI